MAGRDRATAFLALGSNLGDREAELAEALDRLAERMEVVAVSPVYESEPAGYADQPRFLNLVARVETELAPPALLDAVQAVERRMGRERSFRDAPRIIDIDILLYDDVRMTTDALTLPHPRMNRRAFVLRPLADLAPELRIPGIGSVRDALRMDKLEGATTPFTPGPRLAGWVGTGTHG